MWRMAISATLHCLTGCATGEVLGLVLSTWWGWGNARSIALAIVLAFVFGYALTFSTVRRHVPTRPALKLAWQSDTVSIATMEIVDNVLELVIPGAMAAGLATGLFWWSLALSLAIAFVITVPVNRWLMLRGRGHAVVHEHMHH